MSERDSAFTCEEQPEASAAQLPAGTLLRQAREAAGLHIAALAVALKVPVKKLEALEADRFDLLPDAVFVRALASSVCRSLKVDATPIMLRLPQTSSPKLTYQGSGINTPFRAPGDGPAPSLWNQMSRPALLAGLVLLAATLALVFWPVVRTSLGAGSRDDIQSNPVRASSNAENATPARETPGPSDASRPALAGQQLVAPDLVGATPTASFPVLIPALGLANPPPLPASQSATLTAAGSITQVPSPAGIVVFSATSQSWVEVTDSRGQVVLRRMLGAGETAGVSGALPLAAVVGRADATQVAVRGKPLDLGAFSRDNVARFEVR